MLQLTIALVPIAPGILFAGMKTHSITVDSAGTDDHMAEIMGFPSAGRDTYIPVRRPALGKPMISAIWSSVPAESTVMECVFIPAKSMPGAFGTKAIVNCDTCDHISKPSHNTCCAQRDGDLLCHTEHKKENKRGRAKQLEGKSACWSLKMEGKKNQAEHTKERDSRVGNTSAWQHRINSLRTHGRPAEAQKITCTEDMKNL